MKILKKFLLVGLFSLLFFVGVNAKVSDYYSEIFYSDELIHKKETYQNDINLIREYLVVNGMNGWNLSSGNYVIVYNLGTFDTNEKQVQLMNVESQLTFIRNYYGGNYDMYKEFSLSYQYRQMIFSINNGVVSAINSTYGNMSSTINYVSQNCNPTQQNCTLYFNNMYFDTSYLRENLFIPFNSYGSNSLYDIPLKVGKEIIQPNLSHNAKKFFDSFNRSDVNYCTDISNYRDLGKAKNVKSVMFNAKGKLKFPDSAYTTEYDTLHGVFSFVFGQPYNLTEDNFEVELINDTPKVKLIGDYELKCIEHTCFLEYSYSTTSNELVDVSLNFKVIYIPNSEEDNKGIAALVLKSCINNGDISSYSSVGYSSESPDGVWSIFNELNNNSDVNLGFIEDIRNLIPEGPIDSILTLPLKILNTLVDTLNGRCSPIVLSLPFVNTDLRINCMSDFYSKVGASSFFNWVGFVVSTFMLINYFTFLYNWLDNILRLGRTKVKIWGTGEA